MADLIHVIKTDKSEKVREGAVKALGLIKATGCQNYLADILGDIWNQSIRVRRAAAFALGRLDPKVSVDLLSDALINDPDKDVRRESAEAIAICLLKLEKDQVSTIVKAIVSQIDFKTEKDHEVRLSVINAITVAEESGCIDELITSLTKDPSDRVRGKAANALSHFFDPRVEKVLIESLDKEKNGVKKRIALALAHYAMRNPLGLHDEVCSALIYIQKHFPRGSYVWKEAVKALPAY
jgi:HEAT repeat protein